MNAFYFGVFSLYLIGILCIGIWGWQRITDQSDFATAGQGLPLFLVTTSLLATYISALSIIGGVGYASEHGWAFLSLFSFGVMAGSLFLSMTAKRWHDSGVNSVSELLEREYGPGSQHVRTVTSISIVFSFAVILVAQLFGIGFILEGIVGIPMPVAILAVGSIITAYTVLGGMVSVARTDFIQVAVMGTGIVILVVVLGRLVLADPDVSFTQEASHMTVYGGETPNNRTMFATFLAMGFGTAVHPYFIQRLLSAKDVQTARLAPALTAVGAFLIYVSLSIIGIIGALYLPEHVGDQMAPAIIENLMTGVLGAFALLALLAVVQSTTDSLLHVIGVYISQDIYGPYFLDDPTERQMLRWSRIFTAVFGLLCVLFAATQATVGEIGLIALFATYAWGVTGASLFVVVVAAFYWDRLTWQAGVSAVLAGFLGRLVGGVFEDVGYVDFDTTGLAVLASVLVFLVVNYLADTDETRRKGVPTPTD